MMVTAALCAAALILALVQATALSKLLNALDRPMFVITLMVNLLSVFALWGIGSVLFG